MGRAAEGGACGRREVGEALLAYGRELEADRVAQVGGSFSGNADADALLALPNAFLLGVLFTQGIPAERAWSAPYLLKQRLGTLELDYIATHPTEVELAVSEAPMLHRFKHTVPAWVVSAARRLMRDYEGDAAQIWPDGVRVTDVIERLMRFEGIGRKKARMAVQILIRHFDARLTGVEHGQVAYDVQVRRVFLRSGLAMTDDPVSIERAAACVAPSSPGTLDLAAWLIGRQWCRPTAPRCDQCRLGQVCPRQIMLKPDGVGSRRSN